MSRSTGILIEALILVALMLSVMAGFILFGFEDEFMGMPGTVALCVVGFLWYALSGLFSLGKG